MALAGERQARRERAGDRPRAARAAGAVRLRLRAGAPGVAHVFAVDARGTRAGRARTCGWRARARSGWRCGCRARGAVRRAVVAFVGAGGGTDSAAAVVRAG